MSETIEDLSARLTALDLRLKVLEGSLGAAHDPNVQVGKKKISAKEFLLSKKPKGDVQNTFYLGAYLEKYEGLPSFTVDDLRRMFQLSKLPLPLNLNDKVNANVVKGLFMEAEDKKGKKKAWTLTLSGEKELERVNREVKDE